MNKTIYLLCLITLAACTEKGGKKNKDRHTSDAVMIGPYNLNNYQKIVLPQQLDEISGIAWDSSSGSIAAVNDEEGKLFFIDPQTGIIRNHFKFGTRGDYEEIFFAENKWWILASNGRLANINAATGVPSVPEIPNINDENSEFEAAWYDPRLREVLLACKKCPSGRLTIIHTTAHPNGIIRNLTEAVDFSKIPPGKNNIQFRASGAAYHPADSLVYLVSSPDKKILKMTSAGVVTEMQNLDPSVFKQPEGICFGPDGAMYISNEAAGGNANLLIFKPQNQPPQP
jgi:uncharacterized protein YjiK